MAFAGRKKVFGDSFEMTVDTNSNQRNVAIEKRSIGNYIFINAECSIIAIHPASPTSNHLYIAANVKPGSSFCSSRRYGTFWIGHRGINIMQSASYCPTEYHIFCAVDSDDMVWTNVMFDEEYGVSGRLLAWYTQKDIVGLKQFLKQADLLPLKQSLVEADYRWNMSNNMAVKIYEFLYATDFIRCFVWKHCSFHQINN